MLEKFNDVLSVSELQEALQIGRDTAYRLLHTNAIKSVRVGRNYRIPKTFVIQYLAHDGSAHSPIALQKEPR